MNNKTTISYICRNLDGRIISKSVTSIGDISILVRETLAIREAVKHAIQKKNLKIIIENDFLIAIQGINENNTPSFFIEISVEDIKKLVM